MTAGPSVVGATMVGHRIEVPAHLHALARSAPRTVTLHKVAEDIWTTYAPVEPHVDGTKDGLITYGFIIANDPSYTFVHGDREYEIPPGTLYRMDGRIVHSTRGGLGLFAALIWDMPPGWNLADFAAELVREYKM